MRIKSSPDLLKDPKWLRKITRRDLTTEVAQLLIAARFRMGLTQEKLAKKIGTEQSGIARAENGKHLPSLSFLEKISKAYNTNLFIGFESMPDIRPVAVRYQKLREIVCSTESSFSDVVLLDRIEQPSPIKFTNINPTSHSSVYTSRMSGSA
jgi:transcriptional regulator with XRE-family HTH domain